MIIKYEAGGYPVMKKRSFVRETDKFLVRADGYKESKSSSYTSFFDTLEQAKTWLIGNCREKIERKERDIQALNADISAYESIQEGDVKNV